jgi:FkbM family methyltransferase
VERVFPNHRTLGFSGKSKQSVIGPHGLRIAAQVDDETVEVEHPLPPPLPKPPIRERIATLLELAALGCRKWLATNQSQRWSLTLRRHLLYRRQRAGVFRRLHTDALLVDFANTFPEATFLQIGANDGLTGDPLHHLIVRPDTRWRGILVEPVADLFAQLSERYAHNSRLHLERAAVCEIDGTTVIHRLKLGSSDSVLYQQLPSLDPELLRQNAKQFGNVTPPIVTEAVPALSVATLLERHAIKQLDLLVIDTESWDWRILRQFDLTNVRPKLILYEHQHLAPEEREQAHQFLARHNYGWAETGEGDTIAWRLG